MAGESGAPVALFAGRLIDAVSPEPITDGVVCIEGGRITVVGRAAHVPVPRGARRVDLRDRTLLPGLAGPVPAGGAAGDPLRRGPDQDLHHRRRRLDERPPRR